jgi:hypothetical protein
MSRGQDRTKNSPVDPMDCTVEHRTEEDRAGENRMVDRTKKVHRTVEHRTMKGRQDSGKG